MNYRQNAKEDQKVPEECKLFWMLAYCSYINGKTANSGGDPKYFLPRSKDAAKMADLAVDRLMERF